MEIKKHFKLTAETKIYIGITLFRVELISDCKWGKKGDLGGWVEKEENISGNAWVSDDARVSGNARISGYAQVSENARVSGNARVYDNAQVYGNARISGYAQVSDDARISGYARVSGDAWISGYAQVYDNAWVYDNARVYGNARASSKVFTSNFIYNLTLTDNHIQFGCIQKTVQEWIDWLSSTEVIQTKRNTPKFKLIEMSLNLAIEQWRQIQTENY